MSLIEVELPFQGYYNSFLSSMLDHKEEYERQYLEEYLKSETVDRILSHIDWEEMRNQLSKKYVRYYFERFQRNLYEADIEVLNFEEKYWDAPFEMTSPKYYNYSTDRLFIKMEKIDLLKLLKQVKNSPTWKKKFEERISSKFTSYDGFMSHYANTLEEWGRPSCWDHNQWCTLLETICDAEDGAEEALHAEIEVVYDEEGTKLFNRFYKRIRQIESIKWGRAGVS